MCEDATLTSQIVALSRPAAAAVTASHCPRAMAELLPSGPDRDGVPENLVLAVSQILLPAASWLRFRLSAAQT